MRRKKNSESNREKDVERVRVKERRWKKINLWKRRRQKQKEQEAFKERRHLHVCNIWPRLSWDLDLKSMSKKAYVIRWRWLYCTLERNQVWSGGWNSAARDATHVACMASQLLLTWRIWLYGKMLFKTCIILHWWHYGFGTTYNVSYYSNMNIKFQKIQ